MWSPEQYLSYASPRARPFHELMSRVGARSPRRVVDVGCGPGHRTVELAQRWPEATVEALDNAPEMVEAARAAGVEARLADVGEFEPSPDTDVLVSNAVLHWVPDHRELLRDWVRLLPEGAWLALQVPANFAAPSHALARSVAARPHWRAALADVELLTPERVDDPLGYADLLTGAGCAVDAWETTYLHALTGEDAVFEWISGSALRPVRAALDEDDWRAFRAELAPLLAEAYPPRSDGTTWLPFRRVFAVAKVARPHR